MGYRVGVDIGGSFTDFAVMDEADGSVRALKVFSRPDRPGEEVLEGMQQIGRRYGVSPAEISYFTHGTTVGVNSVLQRKGLKLALFVTEGFRDVLEVARLRTTDMFDLLATRPAPLITRDRVFPISERIDADGTELTPVSEASVAAAVAAAKAKGCEGIVVSLLHSYRHAGHEKIVRDICQRLAPELPVFLSSEVWPIVREYERTITSTVSGYVQPRVAHYLGSLQTALKNVGVAPELKVTKSNGGVMSAEQGKGNCIQMILSGTASGVIGASFMASAAKVAKAMSLDIGGTSADVAMIFDGTPQYGVGERIGDFNIFIPSVSVSSVGQGGGSIAWVDKLGVLKVGPESAGSNPGPVCYGRGGTRPTVTDSFVVCGLIGSQDLGYNAVKIDAEAARRAIEPLADELGVTVERTAEAIQSLCISGMYSGVSGLVSRFGIDPREFTLIAFGGAGPMLGPMLAREVGMREVLVPPTPGVLSALGGLVADLKSDFIRTIYTELNARAMPAITEAFADLEAAGRRWLREEQGFTGEPHITYAGDLRYGGQSYEIETIFDPAWLQAGGDLAAITEGFHVRHEQLFGHADRQAGIQVINLRLVIAGQTPRPSLPLQARATASAEPKLTVRAWLKGEWHDVPLYMRTDLTFGHTFSGPAVVAQPDCTTIVPHGCHVRVDEIGNLRISIGAGDQP